MSKFSLDRLMLASSASFGAACFLCDAIGEVAFDGFCVERVDSFEASPFNTASRARFAVAAVLSVSAESLLADGSEKLAEVGTFTRNRFLSVSKCVAVKISAADVDMESSWDEAISNDDTKSNPPR